MHSAQGAPESRKLHANALTVPFAGARWGLAVQFEELPFRVSRVYGDGEAKRAGVSVGDVITHVEGRLITEANRAGIESRLQGGGALAVTFNGAPNEQQSFGQVLAQLHSSGFFDGFTKGTSEYEDRLQKVRDKFYMAENAPQRNPDSEQPYGGEKTLRGIKSKIERSETDRHGMIDAFRPPKIGDWYTSTTHGKGKVTNISQNNRNAVEYFLEFNNGKTLCYNLDQLSKFLKPAGPPGQSTEAEDDDLFMWALSRGHAACPGGHKPVAFLTPTNRYVCDICKKRRIPKGTVMYGCRKCNWDVCRGCKETPKMSVRVANVVEFTGSDWGFVTEFRRFPWTVIRVLPGGQAEKAAVKGGDSITHVDGVKVSRGHLGNKARGNTTQMSATLKAGGNHRLTFNGDCRQCEYILSNFPAEMNGGKGAAQVVQELQKMFNKIGASTTDRQGDRVVMVGRILSDQEVREAAISFQEIFESTDVAFEKKSKASGKSGPPPVSAKLRPKEPKEWTVNEVCGWLTDTGRKNTAGTFLTNEVTGDMLFDLDLATLMEDFGMDRFPSKSVLKAIEKIRPVIQRQSPPGVNVPERVPNIRRAESAS